MSQENMALKSTIICLMCQLIFPFNVLLLLYRDIAFECIFWIVLIHTLIRKGFQRSVYDLLGFK